MKAFFKVQGVFPPASSTDKAQYSEPKYYKSPDNAASYAADLLKNGASTVYMYPYEIKTED